MQVSDFLSRALFEAGLYCRFDDRGDTAIQLAPPLIRDQAIYQVLDSSVLTEAIEHI